MRARTPIFVISLVAGMLLSQLPEFEQQYSQRLGGAIDELGRIVQHFDEDSRLSGYEPEAALNVMATNPERLVRDQASRMTENKSRLDQLRDQQVALSANGSVTSVLRFALSFDRPLAARTYVEFVPALPLTFSGIMFGLLGLLGCYFSVATLMTLLRRVVHVTAEA